VVRFGRDKAVRLYVLRSMLAPRVSARWTDFIRRYYRRAGASGPVARVLAKPLRSYLHRSFGPTQRLKSLVDHYHQMDEILSRDCVRALCRGESIAIARLNGRKDTHFTVSIAASVTLATQREGELVICIARDGGETKLSKLSLSFATVEGQRALVVGGIQGPQGGHKRDVIDATRELYGLRPKDAVLLAARALAAAAAAARAHAVSDANHVLNRLQDIQKFSGYDDYWLERGAKPGGPYGFILTALDGAEPGAKGRDKLKATIVQAVQSFAARNRPVASQAYANVRPVALAPA
jgi:uncharacterized protein